MSASSGGGLVFPSLALVLAFTVVFTFTGLRALARLVVPVGGGDRTAELSHLLMSIAMVGMTWGWPAGADTVGGAAQLVVFGLLALVFVVRLLEPAEHPPPGSVHHLIMLGAMAWMVVAMPRLMAMGAEPGPMAASHGHHGHAAAAGPVPVLMQLVTVAFVAVLCARAFAVVAKVPGRAPVLAPVAAPHGAEPATCTDRRLDLAGHAVMSGGMAAMLVAML